MPQIVFNNGRSTTDAVWDQTANTSDMIKSARERKDRFNLALNKAVNLLRKSNAPVGSKITLEDGQTKSNRKFENHIAMRNDPKSRAQQVALQATLARTSADKQKENLNMVDLAQGQKPTGGGISENQQEVVGNASDLSNKDLLSVPGAVVDKSTGAVTPLDSATNTVKDMYSQLSGGDKNASASTNKGFNTNLSIGGASVTGAQDNVFVNANAQTRIDDSVGYNTNQAMWQAMLDDVGRTYAGDTQFDPSKELAFSRAQLLDETINKANATDTQLAAGMSRYEQGAAGGVKLGDVSVGMGTQVGDSTTVNSHVKTDVGNGVQQQRPKKIFPVTIDFKTGGNKKKTLKDVAYFDENSGQRKWLAPAVGSDNLVHSAKANVDLDALRKNYASVTSIKPELLSQAFAKSHNSLSKDKRFQAINTFTQEVSSSYGHDFKSVYVDNKNNPVTDPKKATRLWVQNSSGTNQVGYEIASNGAVKIIPGGESSFELTRLYGGDIEGE